MRYEPDQPKPELNEKGKVELIDILKESSKWAISLDTVPTSVKGVTLGWVWSEHAEYGFGVNLRWKVYFDRKPNQEEISFVSDSASELLSSVWFRINAIDEEISVAEHSENIEKLDFWVYLSESQT